MRAGDRIRVPMEYGDLKDFTVEEFRHCLGIFATEQNRESGHFTPLCSLYEKGPDSVENYISNYGSYYTNLVQGWMDIPS